MTPALRLLRAALAVTCAAHALCAQSVRYEKLVLDNGMTVILHRDARLPIVAIDLRYQVGAKDEPDGRSGFAHLFEHVMFMGTERAPGNAFDQLMEAGGGHNNASTTEDCTSYFAQGPSALLPTLLWLEADRLEDVGRTMDQQKLDRQREIVRNELRESLENRPYQAAEELVFQVMYPEGHPYRWGILGRHRDLEAATVADVQTFFATFYVPNNLTLAIAGDFDVEATKERVRTLFGSLPRGAPPPRRDPPPVALSHAARKTMLDRVELPRIKMAWHSPARFAEGDAELDLLGDVLADGKGSRLYRRLVVQDRLAVDVDAYQDSFDLGSLFQIDVTVTSGADLDAVERAVDDELQRLRTDGVRSEELSARQAEHELRQLDGLQSIAVVAERLDAYQAAFGEPDSFARDLARFRAVTPQSSQSWAQRVLDPNARGIIRILPIAPERAASPRDERPAPAQPTDGALPMPERFTLSNGIPVALWREPALPLVAVQLAASARACAGPRTAGLRALTAAMLREGAGERDAAGFADAAQQLGAWINSAGDHDGAMLSLQVLKRNLAQACALLADAARRPRLLDADWQRVQALQIDALRAQEEDADVVANRVGLRLLFGPDSPYGWPIDGTPATVAAITAADVRAEQSALFAPENVTIIAAGDVGADELRAVLEERFGDWKRGATAPRALAPAPPVHDGLRVALVDRPDAVQTVVRLLAPAPAYRDAQRIDRQMLAAVLGGTFDSRLNRTLREEHGYTYYAWASYEVMPRAGWFIAWSSVRTDATGAALHTLLAEIDRLRGGDVTPEEIDKARATLRASLIESFATLSGTLDAARVLALNELPWDTVRADLRAIDTRTGAELNALARAALPLEHGVLVLVGDARAVVPQLREAGLPAPEIVDTEARPVQR